MVYARLEVRFARGGWSSGTLVSGVVGEGARGVAVRPSDLGVTHTLLKRLGRHTALPAGSERVGDARTTLAPGSVLLARGVAVLRDGRRVGRVSALWCDRATGRVRHVLVRPSGGLLARPGERVLAAELMAALTPGGIELGATGPQLAALPPYRPDAAIGADLRLALAAALAAPGARRAVKLLVEDGRVHVVGTLETEAEVTSARQAVARVRGVRDVVVDLVAIETLGARVEHALARVIAQHTAADAVSGPAPMGNGQAADVRAFAEHGIVYLEGRVATRELRAALERATLAVAGARVAVNYLAVEAEVTLGPRPVAPREMSVDGAADGAADDVEVSLGQTEAKIRMGAEARRMQG